MLQISKIGCQLFHKINIRTLFVIILKTNNLQLNWNATIHIIIIRANQNMMKAPETRLKPVISLPTFFALLWTYKMKCVTFNVPKSIWIHKVALWETASLSSVRKLDNAINRKHLS